MAEPKVRVFANARVTVSLALSQPWSGDETVAQFRESARRRLQEEVTLMFQKLNQSMGSPPLDSNTVTLEGVPVARTPSGHIKLVKIGEIGITFGDE